MLSTGITMGVRADTMPRWVTGMKPSTLPIGKPVKATACPSRTRLARGSLTVFQLDATAYPGNSGSPLFDPDSGEVIGILNMVLVKAGKESVLAQPSAISYAIPGVHLTALLATVR